jgi:glutaredoxin
VYSDQPPPPSAKGTQKPAPAANVAAPAASTAGLPYALQQATKNFPVTLYTTKDCDACAQGRAYLNKRGVPFTEKTVGNQDDFKVFKDATGASQVPVMMLGSGKQVGFEESAWNGALNAAGYPPNSLLPASYKNPPPAPAAPFTPEVKPTAAGPATGGPAGPSAANAPAPSSPSAPSPSSGDRPPNWFKGF